MLPVMAAIGWVFSAYLLERSARGGALLPILTTFGLAIVIDNLLFEQFGADTLAGASYRQPLLRSWDGRAASVGKLAVLILVVAVALLGGCSCSDLHRDGRSIRAIGGS